LGDKPHDCRAAAQAYFSRRVKMFITSLQQRM